MSLADRLRAAESDVPEPAPPGWTPGVEHDGRTGTLTTSAIHGAPDWSALLEVWDLDPALWTVDEPAQVRAWDAAVGNGQVQRLYYYRASIRRRRPVEVDDLLDAIKPIRPRRLAPAGSSAFLLAVGDLQIGEWTAEGGTPAVVERFADAVGRAVELYRRLRRRSEVGPVLLAWGGDCIQGTLSQGGALIPRLDLTVTEQLRVVRRLMLRQVEAFLPHADDITLASVPGNHDDTYRLGSGRAQAGRQDDSWAVEAAVAVRDALHLAGHDHVRFALPGVDRQDVALEVANTRVGLVHGHQWRGGFEGVHKWWAGQAHGQTPVGGVDVLLTAHRHHLAVQESGGGKLAVQMPAVQGASAWWRTATGQHAHPGVLVGVLGDGRLRRLEVL